MTIGHERTSNHVAALKNNCDFCLVSPFQKQKEENSSDEWRGGGHGPICNGVRVPAQLLHS